MEKLQESLNVTPISSSPEENPEVIRIGEMLKALREKKGDTLQAIADQLRVSAKYLVAIEEHDLKALPEKVYALGFVRMYAHYLGADVTHCSAVMKGALEQLEDPMPRPLIIPDPVAAMPRGWMVLGGLVAVALVYSFWRLMSSQTLPPSELPLENQDIAALPSLPQEAPIKAQEKPPETSNITSPQVSTPETSEAQSIEKSVTPAKQEPAAAASTRALPRDAQGAISFALPANAQLAMTATALSWVEIATREGETVINKNLTADAKESFSMQPLLYLSTGNAGALYLSMNGQLYGPFGKDGEVLRHVPLHFRVESAASQQ